MQKQKGDAKRWLLRQQVRLQAQAVEVQHERAAVAEILAADYNQLLRLTQVLESVERQWMVTVNKMCLHRLGYYRNVLKTQLEITFNKK